jgi:hypothetical protein
MLDGTTAPLDFLRFGIQRKKAFLKDVGQAYNGIVLPANILLYQFRSTPTVIFMCQKPFFVDPMSYLFGQPYESFKKRVKKGGLRFKPSFEKLMQGHGLDPEAFIPFDYTTLLRFLAEDKNLQAFCAKAFGFQRDSVWKTIQEAEDLMTDEQKATLNEATYRPSFLIPPYFLYAFSRSGTSAATGLNARILDFSFKERKNWGDVFPLVFVRKEDLESEVLSEIIRVAKGNDFPGYCIWIEDFVERLAKKEQIKGLIRLVRALSEGGKQVVALYGGYFSMLLKGFGLKCVCHGLAYGEARSVSASAEEGSGPAPIRYYLYDLHCFLTLENALTVLRARRDLICDCPICARLIGGDPENVTRFSREEALAELHFLWSRNKERAAIGGAGIEDAIAYLQLTLDLNEDLGEITRQYRTSNGYEERPIVNIQYIKNWMDAMKESLRG